MMPLLPARAAAAAAAPPLDAPTADSAAAPEPAVAAHVAGEPGLKSVLADMLGPTVEQTPLTGWLVLFGGILAGVVAGKVVQSILRRIGQRLHERGWLVRATVATSAGGPAALAILAMGLSAGLSGLVLSSAAAPLAGKLIGLLNIAAIGWFLYNLVELITIGLGRVTARAGGKVDEFIVPLIRKALRLFLIVVFGLFVAENVFEADITAWLAGLGIAGLAVSLAAQDSVKNLFGSLTILMDRPFTVGQRIVLDKYDGIVESIGFRSTRIRTLAGHLVTVPNMRFTDGTVENIDARPTFRRILNITIAYDTPPDRVRAAVGIVKDILAAPDVVDAFDMQQFPPRVHFNEFNADSLNIQAIYWYHHQVPGRDWWTFQEHGERINERLLRALTDAGIEFAFPTRTVYLASDPRRRVAVEVVSGEGRADPPRG
jgi:MscS family membrane protein